MKKIVKVLMTVAGIILPGLVYGDAISKALIDQSALSVNTTSEIDTVALGLNRLSATAVYSTVTIPAVSVTDGRPSTAAITVSNNAVFTALSASNTITISSNAACKNNWFNLNGVYFVNPQDWAVAIDTHNVGFSTQTAQNIANAINGSASSATFTAARAGSTVFLASKSSGSLLNSYTLVSSTPAALVLGATHFFNGRDAVTLGVNNVVLKNGTHWFTGATAADTAQSISSAIVAYSGGLVISTWNASVIYATSTAINKNTYVIYSSSQAALTVSSVALIAASGLGQGYFQNGSASDISGGYINKSNTFGVGLPVLYSTATGTNIKPLVSQTTYYVTAVDSSKFKLSTSRANAAAGTAVTFTFYVSTGAGTYTLTPIGYGTGAPASFKYERSNDHSNWFDAPVSSGTVYVTAASSGQAVDFGDANFRYYRANFVTSDAGASSVKIWMTGK
jgi:hypothetical protein